MRRQLKLAAFLRTPSLKGTLIQNPLNENSRHVLHCHVDFFLNNLHFFTFFPCSLSGMFSFTKRSHKVSQFHVNKIVSWYVHLELENYIGEPPFLKAIYPIVGCCNRSYHSESDRQLSMLNRVELICHFGVGNSSQSRCYCYQYCRESRLNIGTVYYFFFYQTICAPRDL